MAISAACQPESPRKPFDTAKMILLQARQQPDVHQIHKPESVNNFNDISRKWDNFNNPYNHWYKVYTKIIIRNK